MASNRALSEFPFSPSQLELLAEKGFHSASDLADIEGPLELSKELSVSPDVSNQILRVFQNYSSSAVPMTTAETAWNLLQEEPQNIVTLCQDLDHLMGDGIPLGCLTEFTGVPGVGKTQLGMQLALSVQVPPDQGGLGGEAVYIDTEGSFMPTRARTMASALADLLQKGTHEEYLERIYVSRVHDYAELMATVLALPSFLESHPQVRLVVVDSVSSPFRHGFASANFKRARLLAQLAKSLSSTAQRNQVAVVLTNQVTTRVSTTAMGDDAYLVPALGESWGHCVTHRVAIHTPPLAEAMHQMPSLRGMPDAMQVRCATMVKSPSQAANQCYFVISDEGVRDVPSGEPEDRQGPPQHALGEAPVDPHPPMPHDPVTAMGVQPPTEPQPAPPSEPLEEAPVAAEPDLEAAGPDRKRARDPPLDAQPEAVPASSQSYYERLKTRRRATQG